MAVSSTSGGGNPERLGSRSAGAGVANAKPSSAAIRRTSVALRISCPSSWRPRFFSKSLRGLAPLADRLHVCACQLCLRMHERVHGPGHFAFGHFLAHLFRQFCPPLGAVRAPLRETHFFAARANVVGDEPRCRSHAAVPRPDRTIGVAVVTRSAQDPGGFSGKSRARGNLVCRVDCRVCSRWPDCLRNNENRHNGQNRSFQPVRHSSLLLSAYDLSLTAMVLVPSLHDRKTHNCFHVLTRFP